MVESLLWKQLLFSEYFFKKGFYLFIFRQRGREGEKHQCVAASHTPHTGNLACNPDMCPDWESNWWPFGSQTGAQSPEPHQPGLSEYTIHLRTDYIVTFSFHNGPMNKEYRREWYPKIGRDSSILLWGEWKRRVQMCGRFVSVIAGSRESSGVRVFTSFVRYKGWV